VVPRCATGILIVLAFCCASSRRARFSRWCQHFPQL
jgi:hypothetical protein